MPDATTVFKMSNPELMLDHNKRSSWAIVGGVVAFFSVYLTYTAIFKDRIFDAAPPPSDSPHPEDEVHKVLADGRVLLKDGSIRPARS